MNEDVHVYVSIHGSAVAVSYPTNCRQSQRQVFNVGCAIKPLLALGVVLQIVQGSLELSDPIDRWLPERSTCPERAPTVGHLLTETSGLADPPLDVIDNGQDALDDAVLSAKVRKGHEPGNSFLPCTVSEWQLLALVLARILAPRGIVSYLEEEVLQPLGMENTAFRVGSGMRSSMHPFSLERSATESHPSGDRHRWDDLFIPGLRGYMTVADLGRFYEASMGYLRTSACMSEAMSLMRCGFRPSQGRSDESLGPWSRGLGLQRNLGCLIDVPGISSTAYGSAAYAGSVTGLADPATGVVIAFAFGDLLSPVEALLRRRSLIKGLMRGAGAAESCR
jgi:CubicO group peptidase (beta-lactamase class C family)